jgi:hypothetical protein
VPWREEHARVRGARLGRCWSRKARASGPRPSGARSEQTSRRRALRRLPHIVGSVPDPRDGIVGQDETGAGACALGEGGVSVTIVESIFRERGSGGVHCARLSA